MGLSLYWEGPCKLLFYYWGGMCHVAISFELKYPFLEGSP